MSYRRISKMCVLAINKSMATSIVRIGNNIAMTNKGNVALYRGFTNDSSANCSTIGEIVEKWSHRFESEAVPEPVESIEHIVAHVVGLKKVKILILNFSFFPRTICVTSYS